MMDNERGIGIVLPKSRAGDRRLVTISIPILNEEMNLPPLLSRLDAVAQTEPQYDFEFLFTDNASIDGGFALLAAMAEKDDRIRVLRFSRNFGFQKSILTNYLNARGDAAIQLDADMQDPPELISDFLRKWEQGYRVVYGIRRRRPESAIMHLLRRLYYKFVSAVSESDLPRDVGDFRLIDRIIIEHLRTVREQTPYIRGLISSLGYKQIGLVYDRSSRNSGRSKFNILQLVEFGLDGITAQSVRPLRIITLSGFVLSAVMTMSGIYYLLYSLLYRSDLPDGFTTLVILSLLSIGLNSLIMGLIGEYIGRIFNNTRGLPISIVEKTLGTENTNNMPRR